MNLTAFLQTSYRSMWIVEPGLEYYVRKSARFNGLVELANCVYSGDGVAFGYFRFLKRYENVVPFTAEQVINPSLASLYRRRGWAERDEYTIPHFASPLAVRQFSANPAFVQMYPQ